MTTMKYKIYEVETRDSLEQLGTKEKFWYYASEDDSTPKLFKIGRGNTGENWAEKVASELAQKILLPSASYHFAKWFDKEGVISDSFVGEGEDLFHGNELIKKIDVNYPVHTEDLKIPEYSVDKIITFFKTYKSTIERPRNYRYDSQIATCADVFVGFLVFDCWIGNTDRHHLNWGIVRCFSSQKHYLAPSFDHASSLGCRVSDTEVRKRLETRDLRYSVAGYVKRAQTPFYSELNTRLKTIDVVEAFRKEYPNAVEYWVKQINALEQSSIDTIFSNIPEHLISYDVSEFSKKILDENKKRLLELCFKQEV